MDLTRRHRHSLLTLLALILIEAHFASTAWVDTLPSFADPNGWRFFRMVVDIDDNVFVGGNNVLHHFSPDLQLKETLSLGPVMDHADCLLPSYPCNTMKVSTNNLVHALELVYHLGSRPLLLVCGTVYRMLCQIRPVDNLREYHWVHPFNQSVGYHTGHSITHMYLGNGYSAQHTLFTASNMENNNKDNHFVPFLTSKTLQEDGDRFYFRYSFQNDTAKSAMEFTNWAERSLRSGLMEYGGYIYFLIAYTPDPTGQTGYESRLVRVCTQDGTFQSYSELRVACNHPSGQYSRRSYAAHLGDSPSSDGKSIYVTFFKRDGEQPGTLLCIYPMTDVVRAFTTYPRDCLDTVGHTCRNGLQKDITDFCGSDVSPYSISQPLVVTYFTFLPNSIVTALTTVKHRNVVVAIAGDRSGFIQKISLTSGKIISRNRVINTNSNHDIRNPFVFDRSHKHIYVLKANKIVKFPVASCRVHETCESCFTEGKNDPLNCGWCGGYCAHSEECEDPDSFSRDTCTPSISRVSPQKGPIQGAIKIKITGDNFGSYDAGGRYSVTIAGIPCEILDWKNTEITCTLGSTPEETSGPVELKVSNSPSLDYNVAGSTSNQLNFSYYEGPKLFAIHPNKGPNSGGTNVSLFGENLDFDSSKERFFIIRGRLCNLKGFNKTVAWCVTGKEAKTDYPDKIAIVVDNVTYVMDEKTSPTFYNADLLQSFEYVPDPEILQIQPGITTMSGLMNVTVTGLHLDSVQYPQLVVKVLSQLINLEFIKACWSDPQFKGTKLTCSTPTLADQLLLRMPTSTYPLLAHVSFVMDGVRSMREFSLHQEFLSRLLYYPDPEFKSFGEIKKIADDQTSMEIKGNNFCQGNICNLHLVNNFQIRLGKKESCKVTTISMEFLACELPSYLKNATFIGTNISVTVLMGSTVHHLGFFKIIPAVRKQAVLGNNNLLFLFALIPLALIVIVSIYYCRKIRKKKLMRDAFCDIVLSNRTEGLNDDIPPVPPRDSPFEDPEEELCDEMVTLDRETMVILEELGLIIQKQHLVIGELIGSGQFGKVFKGSLELPNQIKVEIAVKTLYKHLWRSPIKADLFIKEALTMKDFDHPHVLGLLGVCFEGSVPHIVLPFMENGDLYNYIRDNTKVLLVTDLLKFAVDIASGMCYLTKIKFVHRDLAARNCVLDSSLRAKVADFGLSRDIYEGNYYRSQDKHAELPFRWTAPEVIETQVSTIQSDVWSYGVLLWELMTRGSIPYANMGNWDVLPYLKIGNRLNQPQFCPKPLYLSMLACWNTVPKKRPTFFKLHSYVSEIHSKLLNEVVTETSPSTATVGENSMYVHFTIPAQNTVYYDSKEIYLKMEGRDLNIKDIEEAYVVMKDLTDTYVIMNEENVFAAQTNY